MDLSVMMHASPYHRWLGVELTRQESDEIEIRLPYRPEFSGSDEATNIHGGIIATLADITACFAIINKTGSDAPNIDLHLDYLRMAPDRSDLIAVGRAAKVGRTIGVADVEIRTPEGRLVAIARSKVTTTTPGRDTLTKSERS
ncbi:PaaI family thioesterase [Candidatus Flexifilum breve]|uniref:PaaI family thioesterase n=1 Tax=Candidatus Flexifilum breve TaxID=3140694 RepID=UPI0031CCB542